MDTDEYEFMLEQGIDPETGDLLQNGSDLGNGDTFDFNNWSTDEPAELQDHGQLMRPKTPI